jgi:hypothetical protein
LENQGEKNTILKSRVQGERKETIAEMEYQQEKAVMNKRTQEEIEPSKSAGRKRSEEKCLRIKLYLSNDEEAH